MALPGRGMSLRERELLRGNQAPSPGSQRRHKLSEEATLTSSEEEEDISPTLQSRARFTGQKPNMFADEEDEFGFMETKPIVARGQKEIVAPSSAVDTGSASVEQLSDEEPKYYRDNRRPSKGPLRPLRGVADDSTNDDLRKHFLRRPSERAPSAALTAEPLLGTSHHDLRDQDHIASPNLPGVNEKIEEFLEGLKKTKNRPKSVVLSRPRRKPEVLMQAWPADMERLLAAPDAFSKLDCTLEEYIDITCALVGIPVYDDRFEALHQLFTLYVDLKELAR